MLPRMPGQAPRAKVPLLVQPKTDGRVRKHSFGFTPAPTELPPAKLLRLTESPLVFWASPFIPFSSLVLSYLPSLTRWRLAATAPPLHPSLLPPTLPASLHRHSLPASREMIGSASRRQDPGTGSTDCRPSALHTPADHRPGQSPSTGESISICSDIRARGNWQEPACARTRTGQPPLHGTC